MSILNFYLVCGFSLGRFFLVQKYRLYLSRLQKENDHKTSVGKHSESTSRDSAVSFGIQNSVNRQHNDVSSGSYGFSGNSLLVQIVDPRSLEGDEKGVVSMPVAESKRPLTIDVPNPRKPRSSQLDFDHSFSSPESDVSFAAFDSTFPTRYPWCGMPDNQLKQEHKPLNLDDGFRQLPLPGQNQHIQADYPQPAPPISSGPSIAEKDINGPVKIQPLYDKYRSNASHASSTTNAVGSSPVQNKAHMANHPAVEPISTSILSMENQSFNLSCSTDWEPAKKNINWGMPSLATLDEDLKVCWVQGDCYAMNFGLQSIEFPEYLDPGHISDIPIHLNDALRFDYENLYDPTEYSLIDQGLFIA